MERQERRNCLGFIIIIILNVSLWLIFSLASAFPPWVYTHSPISCTVGDSPFFRHWVLELEIRETEPQRDKELVENWVVETTQWYFLHHLHSKKNLKKISRASLLFIMPSFLASSPIFYFPSSWHPPPTPWTVVHIHKHSCTRVYKCWPHNFQRFGHSINLPFLFFPPALLPAGKWSEKRSWNF